MALMHLSNHRTPIGARIQPRHWGQYLDNSGLDITKTFEDLLENERLKLNDPNLVSRLDCVFSFDIDEMQGYYPSRQGDIHHLDTTGLLISTHNYDIITYFSKIFKYNDVGLLKQEVQLMQLYWTGDETSLYQTSTGIALKYVPEHLIGGAPLVTKIT